MAQAEAPESAPDPTAAARPRKDVWSHAKSARQRIGYVLGEDEVQWITLWPRYLQRGLQERHEAVR